VSYSSTKDTIPPSTGWQVPYGGSLDPTFTINEAASGWSGGWAEEVWYPKDAGVTKLRIQTKHPSFADISGTYAAHGENHGKPVFKNTQATASVPDLFLYFWDERDGQHQSGWYVGYSIGGTSDCLAFINASNEPNPPCTGWQVPFCGPVDPTFKLVYCRGAEADAHSHHAEAEPWDDDYEGSCMRLNLSEGTPDSFMEIHNEKRKRMEIPSGSNGKRIIGKTKGIQVLEGEKAKLLQEKQFLQDKLKESREFDKVQLQRWHKDMKDKDAQIAALNEQLEEAYAEARHLLAKAWEDQSWMCNLHEEERQRLEKEIDTLNDLVKEKDRKASEAEKLKQVELAITEAELAAERESKERAEAAKERAEAETMQMHAEKMQMHQRCLRVEARLLEERRRVDEERTRRTELERDQRRDREALQEERRRANEEHARRTQLERDQQRDIEVGHQQWQIVLQQRQEALERQALEAQQRHPHEAASSASTRARLCAAARPAPAEPFRRSWAFLSSRLPYCGAFSSSKLCSNSTASPSSTAAFTSPGCA